jgi:hypothetical protein
LTEAGLWAFNISIAFVVESPVSTISSTKMTSWLLTTPSDNPINTLDISDNYQSLDVTSYMGANASIASQLVYTIKQCFEIFLVENKTKIYGDVR